MRGAAFGTHHAGRIPVRTLALLSRPEIVFLHKVEEGVHRVGERVGKSIAAINHFGGFAEERTFPAGFGRPLPVGHHLFAAETDMCIQRDNQLTWREIPPDSKIGNEFRRGIELPPVCAEV